MADWKSYQKLRGKTKVLFWTFATVMALVGIPVPGHAEPYALVPQTRLRVTVVQWSPLKGEYRNWDAVSGEFTIDGAGEISLPLIGRMRVLGSDSAELALKISERIKTKTGLIDAPETTVQVVEYPPIYVVGAVTAPGAYPFRPGFTVLQALALSGGKYRSPSTADMKGQIGMLGDLKTVRSDILRAIGQIARLKAEATGEEIRFPPELTRASGNPLAIEIMAQEQVIFSARANALKRQLDNYAELQDLLKNEINILGQKAEALERNIKLVDDELTGVKSLVDRGMATVSRRSELERAVAALQSNRLDEVTATMRARQSLSEATRNGLGLRDKHYTDISAELQEAQANLERLSIKEDVIEKTLVTGDFFSSETRQREEREQEDILFSIVRRGQEQDGVISATEATVLSPGDVVKVTIGGRSKANPDLPDANASQ
jgi:protein involved in polysaccharide export with SLBB domain